VDYGNISDLMEDMEEEFSPYIMADMPRIQ
jgi:hypothetical protein